jgi:hypothetical protein
MKKSRHISLCLLYLFFNLIGCHLLSVAYTNNEEISVVRQMPSFAEAGETITVETTVTIGGITNPINGFYFTDEIPEELLILPGTYTATLNGFDLSNITEEVGMLGDVYPATVPYRLILETPPDFIEGNALHPWDELTISFSITIPVDASEGTVYVFPGFNWVGYIAGTPQEYIFGYEILPEATLTIISSSQGETSCNDGNDNDGDGLTDCDDPDCASLVIEAEEMSIHDNGAQVGEYWLLWSNGVMNEDVYLPDTAIYRFEIIARGDLVDGIGPEMELSIDGVTVGTVPVDSETPVTYVVDIEVTAGDHTIALAFYNDYYDPSAGEDRNLYVDKVTVELLSCIPVETICNDDDDNDGDGLTDCDDDDC